jgi:hypothetical protein
MNCTYSDSRLRQVGPHGDLLADAHVRIPVAREEGLQLLKTGAQSVSATAQTIDFKNIFAENFCEKIGIFDSKQSQTFKII